LQRTKEEAKDYRYFPEPDIPPLTFTDEEIANIKADIPELPLAKRNRFAKEYGLTKDYCRILAGNPLRSEYFEKAVKVGKDGNVSPKTIADLMINKNYDQEFEEPAAMIKKIFEVTKVEYASIDKTKEIVDRIVNEQKKAASDYKNGKVNILGFFIGLVQKELKGTGDINLIRKLLEEGLN